MTRHLQLAWAGLATVLRRSRPAGRRSPAVRGVLVDGVDLAGKTTLLWDAGTAACW
ncbi:hypothetical protein ACWD3I_25565 [Streptomyces sp. NPDC002817]|uniref:hypothetical protein n=1 Tax=Streptomyces sp. NPDC088357 TaxID=3154655 RepID=UPI00342C90EC